MYILNERNIHKKKVHRLQHYEIWYHTFLQMTEYTQWAVQFFEEGVLVQLQLSYSSTVCKSEESEYITSANHTFWQMTDYTQWAVQFWRKVF